MHDVDVRIERDLLGEMAVPADALHGIATERSLANFPLTGRPVARSLVHAFGAVKLACARANHELRYLDDDVFAPIEQACQEMMAGLLDSHIVVDALQGGAGTSTNMNVNEVLANRALQLAGLPLGQYDRINPIDDLNLHQSTNDTYPTALKVAALNALRPLEQAVTALVDSFQRKEREFADVIKLGRTQLQDAVPITLGMEFSAYGEAFARDRWRISKCEERLRVVNLGGTAVGTGLGAPIDYVFRAVEHLRQLTGLGIARAENLLDHTQNLDSLVEVSGMLRVLATNLFKIANDLRLLSSGPDAGLGELKLPAMQVGSSIMPGKINPVIPEAVCQAALQVAANDQMLQTACSLGNLELNHLSPLIADSLLGTIDLLTRGCRVFADRCVDGIVADRDRCRSHLEGSVATATALVEHLGYHGAEAVAQGARQAGTTIRQYVIDNNILTAAEYERLVAPEIVTRLGSRPARGKSLTRERPSTSPEGPS